MAATVNESAVAIVGLGPAGAAAAAEADRLGLNVVGFEQFDLVPTSASGPSVQIHEDTTVWGIYPGWIVAASRGYEAVVCNTRAVILACGATDKVFPFTGYTLPGVMTLRGLRRLVERWRLLPGQRFVVVGEGSDSVLATNLIETHQGTVVASVSEIACHQMVAEGLNGVERVVLGHRTYGCDVIVFAAGSQPDHMLVGMAECAFQFDEQSDCWMVVRDAGLMTSQPGVWAVGEMCGSVDVAAAEAEGRTAARAVASWLSSARSTEPADLSAATQDAGASGSSRYSQPWSSASPMLNSREVNVSATGEFGPSNPDCFLCRCEEVKFEQVIAAIESGATTVDDVKRRTRAGMGLCQGVFCAAEIARLIRLTVGLPLSTIPPMTFRPPARGVTLTALAKSSE